MVKGPTMDPQSLYLMVEMVDTTKLVMRNISLAGFESRVPGDYRFAFYADERLIGTTNLSVLQLDKPGRA